MHYALTAGDIKSFAKFRYEPYFLSPAPSGAWRCRRASNASFFDLAVYKVSSPRQDLNLQLARGYPLKRPH